MSNIAKLCLEREKDETKIITVICPCSYLVHRFRHWTLHREPTLSSQTLHQTLCCFPEQREKKKTLIVGMTVENGHKHLEFCSALSISLTCFSLTTTTTCQLGPCGGVHLRSHRVLRAPQASPDSPLMCKLPLPSVSCKDVGMTEPPQLSPQP